MEVLKIQSIKCTKGRSVDMEQFSIARAIMAQENNWESVYMDDYGDLVLFRLLSPSEQKELQESIKCFSNYTELNIWNLTKEGKNHQSNRTEPNHWC